MKTRAPRRKLSKLLSDSLGRYKWVGMWPSVPLPLGPLDCPDAPAPVWLDANGRRVDLRPPRVVNLGGQVFRDVPTPDVPPAWMERIHERLWEEILPLKKGMSWDYYRAAMAGYAWASCQHEGKGRREAANAAALALLGSWGAGKEAVETPEDVVKALEPHRRMALASALQQVGDELGRNNAMVPGFAYGVACRQREKRWTPSATNTTWQIYKAMLLNWRHIQMLTRRKATIRELGEYVATRAVMSDGVTLAQRLNKRTFAAEELAEELKKVRVRKLLARGAKPGKTTSVQCCQRQQDHDAKEAYFKLFEKICGSLNMPHRGRGRPRGNS